jgi:hypothetical protein
MLFLLTNFVNKQIGKILEIFCQISNVTKLKKEKKEKHLILHVKLQCAKQVGIYLIFYWRLI